MTTRAEHMTWVKQRAIAELDAGGPDAVQHAFNSLVSDLRKHPDTADHAAIELGMGELMFGNLQTPAQLRTWIEGRA